LQSTYYTSSPKIYHLDGQASSQTPRPKRGFFSETTPDHHQENGKSVREGNEGIGLSLRGGRGNELENRKAVSS
jgi:hypothetical protein